MTTLREALSTPGICRKINKTLLLILGLILMYFFVAAGLPFLSRAAGFTEEHQAIIDEDIHAGEWFYVFVEQIREIEPRMRDTMRYTPGME